MNRIVLLIALASLGTVPVSAKAQEAYLGLVPYRQYPTYAKLVKPVLQERAFELWLIDLGNAGWLRDGMGPLVESVLDRYVSEVTHGQYASTPGAIEGLHFFCQSESTEGVVCAALVDGPATLLPLSPYSGILFARVRKSGGSGAISFIKPRGHLKIFAKVAVAFSVRNGQATCVVISTYENRWNQASLSVAGLDGASTCTPSPDFLHISHAWGEDISLLTHPVDNGTEVYALITEKAAKGYGELKLYRIANDTQIIPYKKDEKGVQVSEAMKLPKNAEEPFAGFKLMKMYRKLLKDPGTREHKIRYPTREMGAALQEYYKALNDSEK